MTSRRAFHSALFIALLTSPSAFTAQSPATPSLDVFAGEYTVSGQPGIASSFYVQDGSLIVESDRRVPTPLKQISATVFGFTHSDDKAVFSLDASGRAISVSISLFPGIVFTRSGPPVHHVFHDYVRTEAMIPMRDGVMLHVVILKPSDIAAPLPILLERTPYGVEDDNRESIFARRPELARNGYIFVGQDIRGRAKSQGKFIMMRPLADHSAGSPRTGPGPWGGNSDHSVIDESTDTFDTVAWLLQNVPGNNGRVGVVGTSYDGFLAMMAGIDPHPAVKAISPQAPMIDVWIGDDFFHNGAFRQSYGYDYVRDLESTKDWTEVTYGKNSNGSPVDGFDYFLEHGNFARDVKESDADLLPTWKLFLGHPAYDSTWVPRAVENLLSAVAVPTLTVGGYYDQEDMYGPQEEYAKLEPHDTKHQNFLVLGPWRHGYWSSSNSNLGNLDYGEPIGTEFRSRIEARFFAHYLKDEPGFTLENTASFQTGSNTWQYYAHFPPRESHLTSLYLAGAGLLSWNSSTTEASAFYVSDPANPVPYRHRPIQPTYSDGSQWYNWLTEDQRFVTSRKDVAVFRLPTLKQNLTVTGEVFADIFAATTGSDNDLVVKLIDQYPDDDPDPTMRGYQLIANAEIFRGRYLSGYDQPTALAPGSVHEYKFGLHDVDHVFKAGHTVMVEIQSTWFPLYDRNPQTFVPNIMKAKPSDYKPATITIYSGPGHDSALQLPVMNR
jgi:hypothetical protein